MGKNFASKKRTTENAAKWQIGLLAILAVVTAAVVGSAFVVTPTPTQVAPVRQPTPSSTAEPRPYALWVGDSFTEGTGAGAAGYAYPHMVSVKMGWVEGVDAQGGTGFIADGKKNVSSNMPIPARPDRFTGSPKFVIIDAGRNDGAANFATQTTPAVRGYLATVKAKWPDAQVVLVVPFFITSNNHFVNFANLYAEEATRIGALVVDPIKEGWIEKAAMSSMVYTDGIHPNKAGHAYIAERLVERFKALVIPQIELNG